MGCDIRVIRPALVDLRGMPGVYRKAIDFDNVIISDLILDQFPRREFPSIGRVRNDVGDYNSIHGKAAQSAAEENRYNSVHRAPLPKVVVSWLYLHKKSGTLPRWLQMN